MNAKNVTPDETTPGQPTAVETPTKVNEATTPTSASMPVVEKKVKPAAAKNVKPAGNAAKPADTAVVTEVDAPVKAHPTGEVTPVVASTTGVVAPVAASATGEVAPVHAPVQTVYVTAPAPPHPKGNRGVGVLLSVIAAAVFAAVYVGVAAILTMIVDPSGVTSALSTFLTSPFFFVPVLVFLVAMVLWALVANRASWWSWVIGSFVIAAVTYFASIGVFLLMQGGFGMTASAATLAFAAFAIQPALIAATLIARECAIWFGAAIAKRGRKVRERNYEAWQAFEREETQKRAEFGGAAAA